MRRLLLILLAMALLASVTLVWFNRTAGRQADFTFINRGDIGTLDPNRMSWLQDIRLGYALWEGLYTLEPSTLEAIPGAADHIEVSPDGRTWTFHIRDQARWSNGDPLLVQDFIFAWRRMLEEPGDYTYLLHYIRGAEKYQEDFAAGRRPAFDQVGIKSLAERILQVELNHPVAFFPDLCAFPPFFPLHESSMVQARKDGQNFTRPPYLVTNGPYHLASWEFKRRIHLEANEHYWDRANVASRTIDVISAEDPLWAFLKYDTGAVDWLTDATGPIGAELYNQKRGDMHVYPAFGTYFYSVNCQPKLANGRVNPFADVRIRQAFSMALDREPIVRNVTRMGELPASNYIPPGVFPKYSSPTGLPQDVAAARRLLAEAGYPDGKGFPPVSLLFNSEFHHGDIAQIVRRQWLENLGVDVQLEGVEVKIFRQRLHNKDYTLARASWFGDYNDPSTFTDKYRSKSENNDSAWSNPRYDQLCEAAAVEMDQARRMAIFHQAEAILLAEQPIIPIYYYVNASLYRDNVKGLYPHPRNMTIFKAVRVER